MIDSKQLMELVIRPVLTHIGLWSETAEELVIGTAAQESHLGKYIAQIRGPALGIYQMEPATHNDLWNNYLKYQPLISQKVKELELPNWYTWNSAQEMAGNLYYATAMCRVHYKRIPAALPLKGDLAGQAAYWKKYYNTPLGKGTVEEYIANYRRFVKPVT